MSGWEIETYEGEQPYLFISYCRQDWENVSPIIEYLSKAGYRIWYDRGIAPGTEWPEVIAGHLDRSCVFLACISKRSMESHNCRKEFNFAIMKNMDFIGIILEDVTFTQVMKMQMATVQAIKYYEYEADAEFQEALEGAECLKACSKGQEEWQEEQRKKEEREEQKKQEEQREKEKQERHKAQQEQRKQKKFYLIRIFSKEQIWISHDGFQIGRKKELCDYTVTDNMTVSKQHAVFEIEGDICRVRDNQSRNKVYVNDEEVSLHEGRILQDGDLLELGSERFRFRVWEEEVIRK